MLNRYARAIFTRVFTPAARGLVRAGISPDVVTIIGTLGVTVGALAFYPRGEFVAGTLFIAAFVFADLIDGTMARLADHPTSWGAFLDSTLDRLGDAAVFGGLVLWFAGRGDDLVLAAVALYNLAAGAMVSYSKARAEGLGMTADVGIAERADRLVAILLATGLSGLGVPYVLEGTLWLLALASTITIVQRVLVVRRQALSGQSR
jgi:CDP-diacylglycerol--glycerol-3-phosphate 3-phosphatidyltransferase